MKKLIYCIIPLMVVCLFSCKTKSSMSGIDLSDVGNSSNYWAEFIPKNCQFSTEYYKKNTYEIKFYKNSEKIYEFLVLPESCMDPRTLYPNDTDPSTNTIKISKIRPAHYHTKEHGKSWYGDSSSSDHHNFFEDYLRKQVLEEDNVTDEALSLLKNNTNRWLLVVKGENGYETYSSKVEFPTDKEKHRITGYSLSNDLWTVHMRDNQDQVNTHDNFFVINYVFFTGDVSNVRDVRIESFYTAIKSVRVSINYQIQE